MKEKNKGGRPPIHTDPDVVNELIHQYFEWIEGEFEIIDELGYDDNGEEKMVKVKHWLRHPEPPTITGLTLYLGFSHKSSLYEYADKPEFTDPIKKAITRIEKYHEIKVSYGEKCTGNIFVLKNFGWKDTQAIDQITEHKGEIKIVREIKK